MRTVRTIGELRAALTAPRRSGSSIGLVPTMGAFHDGHLSLMQAARASCDVVVVSLFVNPAQFNDAGDLARYPRDEERDAALAEASGVDVLFAPPLEEIYPPGFATTVSLATLTDTLEGAHRGRAHFDGVATVVAKLFNIVGPDAAFFGQKDAQQVQVIRRMARDLDIPVRIEVCPTVREPGGLAMSSRNVHLSPAERERALALNRALYEIEVALAEGESDPEAALERARASLVSAEIEPEYLQVVSPETLEPVTELTPGVLAVVAATVGRTRLIDNRIINPDSSKVATRPRASTVAA